LLISGIVLFVVGLGVAVGCLFWKRSSQKSSGWWAAVEDVDVATALAKPGDTAVAVAGTTVAPKTGEGATLTDPLHDQECCWWRETVTEHWEERVRVTNSSNTSGPDYRWEDRSNEVSEQVSGVAFLVADGTQIGVEVHGIDIDGDLLQESKTQERQGSGGGIAEAVIDGLLSTAGGRRDQYTETKVQTLPAGRKVLVSGRTAGATIIADGDFGLKVCEGTVESQLGDSRRSAKRAHLGLIVGSGLAVLGAVLAAAGAAA
jgi:hypothetical protein